MPAKQKQPAVQPVRVGDVVQFDGRGKLIVGTVARLRVRHSPKRQRLLDRLAYHLNDPDVHRFESADTLVAEVAPVGSSGFWTVPVDRLTVTKRPKKNVAAVLEAARFQVRVVKGAKRANAQKRAAARFEAATPLFGLRRNDPIEVKYRDIGWAPAQYLGMMKSGRVSFLRNGARRTAPPQFVRKAKEE